MSKYNVEYVLNLKDRLSGQLSGIQGRVQKLDSQFGGMGSTIAGAFSAAVVVNFMKQSIEAAMEAEAVDKRLTASAINLAGATQSQADSLVRLGSELQKNSRFGDENIKSQMTQLLQFGLTIDEVKKLTPVIADFAADTNQSIESASAAVIAGLAGQTRGLKKYGMELKLTGDKSQDAAIIMEQLNAKFGGGAQRDLETTAGKIEKLKNQWGDFFEGFGVEQFNQLEKVQVFFKALQGDADALNNILERVQNTTFRDLVRNASPVNVAVDELGIAFGFWNKQMSESEQRAEDLARHNDVMAYKEELLSKAIVQGGSAMEEAYRQVSEVFSITREEFEKYANSYLKTKDKLTPEVATVESLENQIQTFKNLQKGASSREEFVKNQKEIDRIQKQIDKITGKPSGAGARGGAGATSSTLTSRSPQTFNINITKLVETINTTKPQLNTTDSQTMRQITEALVMAVNDVQTTVQ